MSDKHTPLPWHVDHAPWMGLKFGVLYQGSVVAECREITPEADRANARFIVTACNHHAELVEALREVSTLDQMSMENAIGWLEDNCQDLRDLLTKMEREG